MSTALPVGEQLVEALREKKVILPSKCPFNSFKRRVRDAGLYKTQDDVVEEDSGPTFTDYAVKKAFDILYPTYAYDGERKNSEANEEAKAVGSSGGKPAHWFRLVDWYEYPGLPPSLNK